MSTLVYVTAVCDWCGEEFDIECTPHMKYKHGPPPDAPPTWSESHTPTQPYEMFCSLQCRQHHLESL